MLAYCATQPYEDDPFTNFREELLFTIFKEVQSKNAKSPILSKDLGNVISFTAIQSLKLLLPI
ncbi:MAG: hypothetical protein MJZ68_08620, partial [archaeon]|nr:hypothetical protein [archaeon]